MDSDDVSRILVEIMTGKPAPADEPRDLAALRAQLTRECAEITARGDAVDVPHEIPNA